MTKNSYIGGGAILAYVDDITTSSNEVSVYLLAFQEKHLLTIAMGKYRSLGSFKALFDKSVPDILEKIFFHLDYYSFMSCRKVCRTWKELLSSEPYAIHARSNEMRKQKLNCESDLREASKEGNAKEVSHLLKKGVDPDCQKFTPLHIAVENQHS